VHLLVRWLVAGGVAALCGGVALVVLSVVEGAASVALVLVFPVVTGSSLLFLGGVVLIVAGFLTIPFALVEDWSEAIPVSPEGPSPETAASGRSGGVGGLVLVGPVPILFGSWKGVSRRTRVWLALLGAVLLIVALVAFVWLVR